MSCSIKLNGNGEEQAESWARRASGSSRQSVRLAENVHHLDNHPASSPALQHSDSYLPLLSRPTSIDMTYPSIRDTRLSGRRASSGVSYSRRARPLSYTPD